ncbi:unnamed protein product [Rangifer tarandus platyrhynchus]|uniref:Uncharacterized protein n=2 Tax=Rangifer tarandus platyrhynchus TaxID=3082113 RepID=A0ABN8ZKU8_RANTA|nr:unnamed protein product [Rangifer tarandus platyrhynchus]
MRPRAQEHRGRRRTREALEGTQAFSPDGFQRDCDHQRRQKFNVVAALSPWVLRVDGERNTFVVSGL